MEITYTNGILLALVICEFFVIIFKYYDKAAGYQLDKKNSRIIGLEDALFEAEQLIAKRDGEISELKDRNIALAKTISHNHKVQLATPEITRADNEIMQNEPLEIGAWQGEK
jgi:hypothetical protein